MQIYVRCSFLWLAILTAISLQAQKKPIDPLTIDNWDKLEHCGLGAISNNGDYVMLSSTNNNVNKVTLKNTRNNWQCSFQNATFLAFTMDSKKAIIALSGDSISLVTLGTDQIEYIVHINHYLVINTNSDTWMAYITNNQKNVLILRNLLTDQLSAFPSITKIVSHQGDLLIASRQENKDTIALEVIKLTTAKAATIWHGKQPNTYTFDKSGNQLIFTSSHAIWYYKTGYDRAALLISNPNSSIKEDLSMQEAGMRFSLDGRWLFVRLENNQPNPVIPIQGVSVDIWSYKDPQLQSKQLHDLQSSNKRTFWGVISLENLDQGSPKSVIQIEHDDDFVLTSPETTAGDYEVLEHRNGGSSEDWWNPASMPQVILRSLKDGHQTILTQPRIAYTRLIFTLSPGGKYIVYFDNLGGNRASLKWYSYEISTGKIRCLTKNLNVPFNILLDDYDMPLAHYASYGLAGWVGTDKYVLIKDQYDVWQFDLSCSLPPINLTGGYGRLHKVKFDLLSGSDKTLVWKNHDEILLNAFDTKDKNRGFFTIRIGESIPKELILAPYKYDLPTKALDSSVWIFWRQNATNAPNWFLTRDWKTFTRLTNIQPQANNNWLTSELVNWKTFDGRPGQGILYKPENFDPKRKYPVIVNYYEQKTAQLNTFLEPRYSIDEINVPYIVSRGYLVFVPDIHYSIGKTGNSAFNYIVSGSQYIKTLPYVDGNRMGLQGHSFGGYETDYIITHSTLFAAAVSASGWPDIISRNGAILLDGVSGQMAAEIHRTRIGASLWQRPDLYIENSPIFKADNVETPLLMMNNELDDQVPFQQGTEFFTALRRLQKPVWMLQYDGQGHSLTKGKEAGIDFTIRMTQFFDHYLNSALPPKWMTQGIPASKKGLENGYELDNVHSCSENCKVCKKKQGFSVHQINKTSR